MEKAQLPSPSDTTSPLDEGVSQTVLQIPPPPNIAPPLDQRVFQTVLERPPPPYTNPPYADVAVSQVVIQQPEVIVPQTVQYAVQAQVVQPGVNQMVMVHQNLPRDCAGQMRCPHCNTTVTTSISYKNGWTTWLIVLLLFFVGCWPCFIIPFFVDSCKDVVHSCPICNNVIHIHKIGGF